MKTGFLITVLLSTAFASMGHAAPSCRQVLKSSSSTISDEAITEAISQIARLKLNLDEAQTEGKSIAHQFLAKQYPPKFQEMVQQLQGRLSEQEISELIKKEIRRIQASDKTATLERERQIHQQKIDLENNVLAFTYERIEKDPGKYFSGSANVSEKVYLPKMDAVLYFDSGNLVLHPLSGGYTPKLMRQSAFTGALLNDGNTLLTLEQKGGPNKFNLVSFDTDRQGFTNSVSVSITSDKTMPENIHSMTLSNSNQFALINGGFRGASRYSLIETSTGTEKINQDSFPQDAVSAAFLNEQQVVVLRANSELVVIDIHSGKEVTSRTLSSINFDPYSSAPTPDIMLSNDGKTLAIAHKNGFIGIDATNISRTVKEVSALQNDFRLRKSYKHLHSMFVYDGNSNEVRLMSMETFGVQFVFQSASPTWKTSQVAFSGDGADVIIASFTNKKSSMERKTEHWHRKDESSK